MNGRKVFFLLLGLADLRREAKMEACWLLRCFWRPLLGFTLLHGPELEVSGILFGLWPCLYLGGQLSCSYIFYLENDLFRQTLCQLSMRNVETGTY